MCSASPFVARGVRKVCLTFRSDDCRVMSQNGNVPPATPEWLEHTRMQDAHKWLVLQVYVEFSIT